MCRVKTWDDEIAFFIIVNRCVAYLIERVEENFCRFFKRDAVFLDVAFGLVPLRQAQGRLHAGLGGVAWSLRSRHGC